MLACLHDFCHSLDHNELHALRHICRAWGSSIFRYARHLKDYKPQLKTLGMQVIIGSLILDPVSCQTRLV